MLILAAPERWKHVVRLGFSRDCQSLFGGCHGYGYVRWDIATGDVTGQHRTKVSDVLDLLVHPVEDLVCVPAYYEGLVELCGSTFSRTTCFTTDGPEHVELAAFSPGGHRVAHNRFDSSRAAGAYHGLIGRVLSDGTARKEWQQFNPRRVALRVRYLPPEDLLLSLDQLLPHADGRRLTVRDPRSGEIVSEHDCPTKKMEELVAAPDGSSVVLRAGQAFWVWDPRDFAKPPRKVPNDNRLSFTGLAFHPSGRYLGATSNDTTVKLFDTDSWRVATTYAWDIGRLRSIAFSPDGTLAAVGSDEGKIVVWDVDV